MKWMIKIPETTLVVENFSKPSIYRLEDDGLLKAQITQLPEWKHGQKLITLDEGAPATFLAPSADGTQAVVQLGNHALVLLPWGDLEEVKSATTANDLDADIQNALTGHTSQADLEGHLDSIAARYGISREQVAKKAESIQDAQPTLEALEMKGGAQ